MLWESYKIGPKRRQIKSPKGSTKTSRTMTNWTTGNIAQHKRKPKETMDDVWVTKLFNSDANKEFIEQVFFTVKFGSILPGLFVALYLANTLSLWSLKISLIIFCLVFVIAPFIYKYLYSLQRSLVYLNFVSWPRNPNFSDPSAYGIDGVRNLYLTTDDDVQLGLWQILPEALVKNDTELTPEYFQDALKDGRDVIIYNHGNSGHRLAEHRVELYHLLRKKYHVICWDYRGYGDSSNIEPTETGLVSDAKFVYKWVLNQTSSNIFLWGHSLGTGVSTHMLADLSKEDTKKPRGLILESPFTSFTEEIAEHPFAKIFRPLPWFHYTIIDPMLKNGFVFASDKHIIKVDCPIWILHAEDDAVVPYILGKKLYDTAVDYRRATQGNISFEGFPAKLNYGHKYICRAPELPSMVDNFLVNAAKESEEKQL